MSALEDFGRTSRISAAVTRLARVKPRAWWVSALIGLGAALVAVTLRAVLSGVYMNVTGFMILLPAVILASLAAGRWAGATATVICLLGGWLVVGFDAVGSGLTDRLSLVATINFVIVGLFVTVVASALREMVAGLDASMDALRQSSEQITEGESRFRLVADNIPNLAWMADPDGAIYWYNQRWYDYTGAAPDQMTGTAWQAAHDPALVDGVTERFNRAIRDETPWEDIFPLRAANGDWRWFLSRALPIRDESGRLIRWFGTNTDITEQRAAQAALAESNTRFQLMADTAPSPVWMTNAEAEVEFVNAALVRFFGQSAEDLLGHVWKQAVHPDDRAMVESAVAVARPEKQPYGFEARFRNAAGDWPWMRVTLNPRFDADGAFLGYVGMSFDTTATREALAALERQERRQSFLLGLSDQLRDLTSPDAVILAVERAVGLEFGADRVGYGEVDQARGVVSMTRDWTVGVVSAQGQFSLEELGADLISDLAEGRVIQIADVQRDPRTRDALDVFRRLETRALMRAPVIRGGDLAAFFYVHHSTVRAWTAAEAALLQDVAVRTWTEIERTRAEAEVRESEQRFRAIADTAPVLIWVTQQDRSRAFVNEAYVAFYGGDYEDARLADWRAVTHPDDHARIVRESLDGEASGQPFSMEARYLRQDGEYRWLKSFSRPRLGGDGEVIGFVGVAFDVTDMRESAAHLVAAAAEREAILGQLAEGVIVTDPDGRISFVNEAAVRLHGVERLDVGPDDYTETYHLFTEDGRPYPTSELPLTRAVVGGETILDARWRIRRPDGSEVVAVGNARPVFNPDGSRIGAVLTLRDETARVAAENRLAESEMRFRTVADSAPVFIWMTDTSSRITFANRHYQTVFGVDVGDLMGAGWRDLAHADDVAPFSRAFIRAMKARTRFEGLLRIQHPELGLRWLRCESIPRFDAAGVFQGYVGASLDVTDAKRGEDDLKRINELLEERVGAALAEKAEAEANLMHAQRMEAVGRLTGGVAHDFNNLLTVVIGALDIILRSPNDAAKRQKLGEAALAAARRGEGLTHQLLAFSRRQALRPEAVDLNVQIRESEPLLRRAVGEAVEFKLKLRRGGARVSVDPAQFEAALLNLVVNARDAVGDTGRITVQTQSCTVNAGEVPDLPPGDYVCVSVTDNGVGMTPEVIDRVFEPFFTTKAIGKGTGLGLSQVYGFARQSGGAAGVSSKVGSGTEIKLYLPPQTGPAPLVETGPAAALPMAAGRRLLLVEDDISVAAVALELLKGLGLEVRTVETAPQALDLLKRERFDMMLSDVVMPGGMTGIELARICGRDYPDMRVVLTSGYAGEDVDAALADAPWPFLRKPYSGEQLARILGDLG
jgi:PAS domain S-box-containing protein